MGLNEAISSLNEIQDVIKATNTILKNSEIVQPAYEMHSQSQLPKTLNNALSITTAEKLRQAIFALLTGQSENISQKDGTPAKTGECNDAFQNENKYDKTFSLPKHITSKETISEYESKGVQTTVIPKQDPITKLTKYDVRVIQQENTKPIPQANGEIKQGEILSYKSQSVGPTNYTADKQLQTLVNSIVVTISNTVAEAVTKVIMSKIETNQTEIEIEWNPEMLHDILMVNFNGPVVPGPTGSVISTNGKIAFKGGNKYKHKCRISFGEANLIP